MRASLRSFTKVAARNDPIPVRPGPGAPCGLSRNVPSPVLETLSCPP